MALVPDAAQASAPVPQVTVVVNCIPWAGDTIFTVPDNGGLDDLKRAKRAMRWYPSPFRKMFFH